MTSIYVQNIIFYHSVITLKYMHFLKGYPTNALEGHCAIKKIYCNYSILYVSQFFVLSLCYKALDITSNFILYFSGIHIISISFLSFKYI